MCSKEVLLRIVTNENDCSCLSACDRTGFCNQGVAGVNSDN
jgi:hypothetical protein